VTSPWACWSQVGCSGRSDDESLDDKWRNDLR